MAHAASRRRTAVPEGRLGEPRGRGTSYHETQRLARDYSPAATKRLIAIIEDEEEDSRNQIIAAGMILDHAWGTAKQMPEPNRKEVLAEMADEPPSRRVCVLRELPGFARNL
jgi:hypothetical protein